jgi:broad specificity phosphatase PhoE
MAATDPLQSYGKRCHFPLSGLKLAYMTRPLIHLVRHGRPACFPAAALSRDDYLRWLAAYDAAGIIDQPPETTKLWIQEVKPAAVFSSSLLRSVRSASFLAPINQVTSDALFNEASVSVLPIQIRLSSTVWTSLGRTSWLLGNAAEEHVVACRVRARDAADALLHSASSAETLLVGHGWMNGMICRELQRSGMHVLERTGRSYWSRTSLSPRP